LVAPLSDAADMAAYPGHIALLRKTIDRLLTERDHIRALMLRDRVTGEAAVNLAEARLAGVQGRADQLEQATANLREQLRTALDDLARLQGGVPPRPRDSATNSETTPAQ
jgi:hypothetical protein